MRTPAVDIFEIVRFLRWYKQTFGYSAGYRDVMIRFELTRAQAKHYLKTLRDMGYITAGQHWYSLEVVYIG